MGPLLGVLALCQLLTGVPALRMVKTHFPIYVKRGDLMNLTCDYDLEGSRIYQVKWYKDEEEFYSYAPGKSVRTFNIPGINVNLKLSGGKSVVIDNVDRLAEGKYGCEVTVDETFDTVLDVGEVKIAEPPLEGPVISGLYRDTMETGERVRVNCTSRRSRPAAKLTWFINNARTDNGSLVRYPETVDPSDLRTSTLGLDFRLKESHCSPSGQVKLKCTAEIESAFYNSRDVWITSMTLAQRMPPSSGTGGCLSKQTVLLIFALLFLQRLPGG